MREEINKPVEVVTCDFCKEKIPDGYKNIIQCVICGRDMCEPNKHAAYSIFTRVHRYKDRAELFRPKYICIECAEKKKSSEISNLLELNARIIITKAIDKLINKKR